MHEIIAAGNQSRYWIESKWGWVKRHTCFFAKPKIKSTHWEYGLVKKFRGGAAIQQFRSLEFYIPTDI